MIDSYCEKEETDWFVEINKEASDWLTTINIRLKYTNQENNISVRIILSKEQHQEI